MRAANFIVACFAVPRARGVVGVLFTPGDVEDPSSWNALLAWAHAASGGAHAGETATPLAPTVAAPSQRATAAAPELVMVSADLAMFTLALFAVSQLHTVGVSTTLVHAVKPEVCVAHEHVFGAGGRGAAHAFPPPSWSSACAWSSWRPGASSEQTVAHHQLVFIARKRLLKRLCVDGGVSVLQVDLDTLWFHNPLALLGRPPFDRYDIVVQADVPWANGGIVFARASNSSGARWLLCELASSVEAFASSTSAIRAKLEAIVPWLSRASDRALRKVGWADEQNHLNDLITSAALGVRSYENAVWKNAYHDLAGLLGTPRDAMAHWSARLRQTAARVTPLLPRVRFEHPSMVRSAQPCGNTRPPPGWGREVRLRPPNDEEAQPSQKPGAGGPRGGSGSSLLLVAPAFLFAHVATYQRALRECAARAAPVVGVHLAGLPRAFRRPAMRSFGSIWPAVDAAAERARRHLARVAARFEPSAERTAPHARRALFGLRGFDMRELRNAHGAGARGAKLRLVMGPLVVLAACLGREAIAPRFPCARLAAPSDRKRSAALEWQLNATACAHDGGDGDSESAAHGCADRLVAGALPTGPADRAAGAGATAPLADRADGECLALIGPSCSEAIVTAAEAAQLCAHGDALTTDVVAFRDFAAALQGTPRLPGPGLHRATAGETPCAAHWPHEQRAHLWHEQSHILWIDGGGAPIGELVAALAAQPRAGASRPLALASACASASMSPCARALLRPFDERRLAMAHNHTTANGEQLLARRLRALQQRRCAVELGVLPSH